MEWFSQEMKNSKIAFSAVRSSARGPGPLRLIPLISQCGAGAYQYRQEQEVARQEAAAHGPPWLPQILSILSFKRLQIGLEQTKWR